MFRAHASIQRCEGVVVYNGKNTYYALFLSRGFLGFVCISAISYGPSFDLQYRCGNHIWFSSVKADCDTK